MQRESRSIEWEWFRGVVVAMSGVLVCVGIAACASGPNPEEDENFTGLAPGLLEVLEGGDNLLFSGGGMEGGVGDVAQLMEGSALPTMLEDIEGEEYLEGVDDDILAQTEDQLPQPDRVTGWFRSAQAGIYRAQMMHRPIILWIGHSGISAPDRQLDAEVFGTAEFKHMMLANAVGVRIDFGDATTARSEYYQSFRDRYDVRGYPTVLVLRPGGQEVERYLGYRDGPEAYMQRIRVALARADRLEKQWLKQLEGSDFRWFTNRDGMPVFGKVLSRREDEVILMEAHGRRFRVPLESFSAQSLVYVLEELLEKKEEEGVDGG